MEAYRSRESKAPYIIHLGNRWKWRASRSGPLNFEEELPVPTVYEVGLISEPAPNRGGTSAGQPEGSRVINSAAGICRNDSNSQDR